MGNNGTKEPILVGWIYRIILKRSIARNGVDFSLLAQLSITCVDAKCACV